MNYRIKETRKQLHLTQMEFAKLLGIGKSGIHGCSLNDYPLCNMLCHKITDKNNETEK